MGQVGRQDRFRLLVLWFFNYLKNDSDFLWRWDADKGKFVINKKLEAKIEKAYRKNLGCLTYSSCFIKPKADDNCTPVSGLEWQTADSWKLMVSNSMPQDINGSYPQEYIVDVLNTISKELEAKSKEGFFFVKDHEDGIDDIDKGYMTSNNDKHEN